MTLVVGIRCTDGVVIGSDSAMTFGPNVQVPTIQQTNNEKVEVLEDKVIISGSGQIGLGQRFKGIVGDLWKSKELDGKPLKDGVHQIAASVVNNFSQTGVQRGQYGALLAMPNGSSAELIEFTVEGFQPEIKTAGNWYVSMGSGQTVADPLLGFVRKAYWGDDAPNHQEGVLAAMFVLHLACSMVPMGVAEPIQMAILARSPEHRGQLRARHLTEAELSQHRDVVRRLLTALREFGLSMAGAGVQPTKPPSPPGAEAPAAPS